MADRVPELSRHTHVVLPPLVAEDRSTPFASAVITSGTAIEKS